MGREASAWHDAEIVRVVRHFVRVHDRARHFDRAHKVEVVVAEVVSEGLNLEGTQRGRVLHHEVVHGQSGRNRGPMRHHVEIKASVSARSRVLRQPRVDDGAGGWVGIVVATFLDKARVNLLIYETVDDLGVVVALEAPDCLFDHVGFVANDLLLVAGSTNSIPIHNNLLGKCLVELKIVVQGAQDKVKDDIGASLTHLLLLLFLREFFADQFVQEVLLDHLGVVLSQVARIRSCEADDGGATRSHNVSADDHAAGHLLGFLKPVKIFFALRVDLLQDVGVDGDFGPINCARENELRRDAVFVQNSLDLLLVAGIVDYNHCKLVVIKWEFGQVFHIALSISHSAKVVWNFAPKWLLHTHTKRAASLLHVVIALVGSIIVFIGVNDAPLVLTEVGRFRVRDLAICVLVPVTLTPISVE